MPRARHMTPTHDRFQQIIAVLSSFPGASEFAVSVSVGAVLTISAANIVFQAVAPADVSWVEHLTLEGALVVAVAVLWRALTAKDAQLMESTKKVTEALAIGAASNTELRASNTELRKVVEHLSESLEVLTVKMAKNGN